MLSHCRVPNLYYTIKLGHPQEGKTPVHLIPVIVNHLHSRRCKTSVCAAAIELRLSSVCSFLLTSSLSYTFHWGKEKFRFNKILRAVTAKPKEEMCRCKSDSERGRSFLATSTQNLHIFSPAVYQSVHVFIACRAQIFVLCSIPLSPENSNIFIELTDARPNETEKLLPAGALWSLLTW